MNYCNLEDENHHIKTLIEWLFDEVISAGGDGDGIWYSKIYDTLDIHKFIIDNGLLPENWTFALKENSVSYWDNQESLYITNNLEDFDSRPPWQQVSLVY
jgi:hypothetical protein